MATQNHIQMSIAPIAWTNDDLPELGGETSFEQCIDEMSLAGYTGCEVGNKFPRDPVILQKALSKRGLQVSSAWLSSYFTEPNRAAETIDSFIKHMNFLKQMGSDLIVVAECGNCTQQLNVPILSQKPIFDANQWNTLTNGLEKIGSLAKEQNMTIVYHYHMGTGVQNQNENRFFDAEH